MTWSRGISSWDFVLVPAIIALSCIAAWGLSNWFWALITEFSYWGELRKLPSHSMDIPTNLSATDCSILQSQGSTKYGVLHRKGSTIYGFEIGLRVWVVEQGLILKVGGRKLRLADRLLGMLRIAKTCCDVERSDPDRVIVWMQVGPYARPPFRVGVELNHRHTDLLDRWGLEESGGRSQTPTGENELKT